MPLVSIIIPYFNRSVLLQQTIQSILDQTYKHWEIIIIDDGSDKSELDILYYYALQDNIRVLFRTKEKKGPSSCRNIGIKNAKGNYIIFIDSDDLIGPYCLENRVKKMQIDSSLNFSVFNMKKFRIMANDSNELFSTQVNERDSYLKMFLRLDIPWQVMAVIWQKKTLENLQGFNEEMDYAEDPELHIRALLLDDINYKVFSNIDADCYYRVAHDVYGSTSLNFEKSIKGRIKFFISAHKTILQIKNINDITRIDYLNSLRKAHKNIVSHFFNDTKIDVENSFTEFNSYCFSNKLITFFQYLSSKILVKIWQKKDVINKKLHYKGLFTKIYLKYL